MSLTSTTAPTATASRTGPSRIFIVRHGDRMDHEDPSWRATTTRPHDSPLSRRGHVSAHLLGRYLVNQRGVRVVNLVGGETEENKETATEGSSSLNYDDIVFLTSPLQRCVETAHGILYGMLSAAAASSSASSVCKEAVRLSLAGVGAAIDKELANTDPHEPHPHQRYVDAAATAEEILAELGILPAIPNAAPADTGAPTLARDLLPAAAPIYLEPSVIEGEYWMNGDLRDGVTRGNTNIRLQRAGANMGLAAGVATPTSEDDDAADDRHDGVYRAADFHRKHVSRLVSPTALTCPLLLSSSAEENTDEKEEPERKEKLLGGAGGVYTDGGFGFVGFDFDPNTQRIIEHSPGIIPRCKNTITNISNSPALQGKTVIVVGHGETTWEMVKGLLYFKEAVKPYYTSFSEGVPMTKEEIEEGARARQRARMAPRGAAAAAARGASGADPSSQPRPPLDWHRWRAADGTVVCDAPHLRMVEASNIYASLSWH